MKVWILLLGIGIYILIIWQFFSNSGKVKRHIASVFPLLYSSLNSKIVTVTIYESKEFHSKSKSDVLPISNEDYQYIPEPFSIDSTEDLKAVGLDCLPDSFGYSIEQGNEVFPPYDFPKCSIVNEQNDTYLHIDRETNTVSMNCPEGSNKKILAGPFDDRKFVLYKEAHDKWEVDDYEGPINADKFEFGLGSCNKDDGSLKQADMFPNFNKPAFEAAKKKSTKGKPRIIYYLTLDSFARRHFFRMLPGVVKTLNNINRDSAADFSVFDFNFHNIIGVDSPGNQVPILGGNLKFTRKRKGNQNGDFLGDKAIWNILREKGYVSLLGFESCADNFLACLGESPNVDYAVGNFYCAVEQYSSISPKMQRCIGGHQSHYYILNYTLNVVDLNPGVNMFMYIHIDTAQHVIKQHAATLDDDLSQYLQKFLSKYKDSHEIFIFLQADHGTKYGEAYTFLEANMEHKLPAFFAIASKSLLQQYPYSYNSLEENTKRLTSKMDLRETALYLAGVIEEAPYSINLLAKIASKSRSCDELEISPWLCSCYKMKEIKDPQPKIKFLLERLKGYSEHIINSVSYTDPNHPVGQICKKVQLENITMVQHIGINNVQEIYKVDIESPTQKNLKFQITYFLTSDGAQMSSNKEAFIIESSAYGKTPIKVRVISI